MLSEDNVNASNAIKNAETSPVGRYFLRYNIIEDDIRNVV